MTDPVIFSLNGGNGEPDRLGAYDDFAATENRSADFAPGLVSLGFIKAAIRRSARFLFVMAVVGLLVGFGYYVKSPHAYQASASVLLTLGPYENSQTAAANNQAIAETSAVAELAVQELGLQQSASSFLNTYTVTSVTDRVLTITASAPSANQAVLRASAVANAFLKFRADELHGAAEPRAAVARPAGQPGQATCQLDQRADQPAIEPAHFTRAAVADRQAPGGTNQCDRHAVQPSGKPSPATRRPPSRP